SALHRSWDTGIGSRRASRARELDSFRVLAKQRLSAVALWGQLLPYAAPDPGDIIGVTLELDRSRVAPNVISADLWGRGEVRYLEGQADIVLWLPERHLTPIAHD